MKKLILISFVLFSTLTVSAQDSEIWACQTTVGVGLEPTGSGWERRSIGTFSFILNLQPNYLDEEKTTYSEASGTVKYSFSQSPEHVSCRVLGRQSDAGEFIYGFLECDSNFGQIVLNTTTLRGGISNLTSAANPNATNPISINILHCSEM